MDRKYLYVIGVKHTGFNSIDSHTKLGINEVFKIGIASNYYKRIAGIQTACPFRIELKFAKEFEHAKSIEKAIHWYLNESQIHGEWFRLDGTTAGAMIEMLQSLPDDSYQIQYFNKTR